MECYGGGGVVEMAAVVGVCGWPAAAVAEKEREGVRVCEWKF